MQCWDFIQDTVQAIKEDSKKFRYTQAIDISFARIFVTNTFTA